MITQVQSDKSHCEDQDKDKDEDEDEPILMNRKYEERFEKELGKILHHPNEYLYQKFYCYEKTTTTSDGKCMNNRHLKLPEQYERVPKDVSLDYHMQRITGDKLPALEEVEEDCIPYFSWHQSPEEAQHDQEQDPFRERRNQKKIFRMMIISDTHDRHHLLTNLPSCDLFIHCGDIAMKSRYATKDYILQKYTSFYSDWLIHQPFHHCILIGGNHDKYLESLSKEEIQSIFPINPKSTSSIDHNMTQKQIYYLRNERILIDEKISIFATPLSHGTSTNNAFQSKEFEEETIQSLLLCENPIDIFISHGPLSQSEGSVAIGRLPISPRLFHLHGHLHYDLGCQLVPRILVTNQNTSSNNSNNDGDNEGKGRMDSSTPSWQHVVKLNASLMDMNYEASELPLIIDVIMTTED